jgi:hypothetical protein
MSENNNNNITNNNPTDSQIPQTDTSSSVQSDQTQSADPILSKIVTSSHGNAFKKYGQEFQTKCISALLSDKLFTEQIHDILDPYIFELDSQQWIVRTIINYFIKHKSTPTLTVFSVEVNTIKLESLRKDVIEQLRPIFKKINDADIKYIKEQFLNFCKTQALKNAVQLSAEMIANGDTENFRPLIDKAMKAGQERNLGHDYIDDIEFRMSNMCRKTIPTNWGVIDQIMDGGLAPGELGIIVAPGGIGKCVGPNTEIEIQYHEIGIEITGLNTGAPHVIWINPFEKYLIDDKTLYGWQVENVFYELDLLKTQGLEYK